LLFCYKVIKNYSHFLVSLLEEFYRFKGNSYDSCFYTEEVYHNTERKRKLTEKLKQENNNGQTFHSLPVYLDSKKQRTRHAVSLLYC